MLSLTESVLSNHTIVEYDNLTKDSFRADTEKVHESTSSVNTLTIHSLEAKCFPKDDRLIEFVLHWTLSGCSMTIEFVFNLLEDTPNKVVQELQNEFQFRIKDDEEIVRLIESEVEKIKKERSKKQIWEILRRAQTFIRMKRPKEAKFLIESLLRTIDTRYNVQWKSISSLAGTRRLRESDHNSDPTTLSNLESCFSSMEWNSLKQMASYELGRVYLKLNELSSAQSYFERHLETDKEESSMKSLIGLAKIYALRGQFKRAEAILKNILLEGHDESVVHWARRTLAKVYEMQGKLYEAEMVFKRLYDERRSSFLDLEAKAEKAIRQSEFNIAQHLFKEALQLKESSLPLMCDLAHLYVKHNKNMEALICFQSCLELQEKLKDSEHFSIAETLNNIAKLNICLQNYAEAEKTLQRSLRIVEKALQSSENLSRLFLSHENNIELGRIQERNLEVKKIAEVTLKLLADVYQTMERSMEFGEMKRKLEELCDRQEALRQKCTQLTN